MKIHNHRDFWSGVMFIIFGVLFMILSRQYNLGTAAKMGPGYFPTVLGGIMAVLGLIILVPAFRGKGDAVKVDSFKFRGNFFVLLAVAAFGATLGKLGFVVASALLIVISAYGSHEFKWKETIISALVLVAGCYLVFVKGLELQFPVWPVFFK